MASLIVGTAVVSLLAWIDYFSKERQIGVIVGLFFLIILAQGIANFMVDACQ